MAVCNIEGLRPPAVFCLNDLPLLGESVSGAMGWLERNVRV